MPTVCIVCGSSTVTKIALCEDCAVALPWITSACCKCGASSLLAPERTYICNGCLLSPPPFRFCRGLFHYTKPVDDLITGFKFHARFDAGHAFANLLAIKVREYYLQHTMPDVILPVPLHSNRLRTRGYNQAVEIAKVVASVCQVPMHLALVSREKDTAPQTEIGSAVDRRRNLHSAFHAVDSCAGKNVKSIAIIDDVVTTMATVFALSQVLKLQGIEVIDIWCIARASR